MAILGGLIASSGIASAQSDTRGVGVAERARPDYDPLGLKVGSFRLLPAVDVELDASDNYRATDTNRQSDIYGVVEPEVDFASTWGRHRLAGRVYYSRSIHAKLPTEDAGQYGASLNGALDVSRDMVIRADASVAHLVESRSSLGSFRNALEPVSYNAYHAAIGVSRQFNRLKLDGSAGWNYTAFNDVLGTNGAIIDQQFRSYRSLSQSLSAQYDIGNGIGVIVSGNATQNRYKVRPGSADFDPLVDIDRQSSGLTLQGGLTFELSSLIFGTIQAGYLRQKYRDPRLRDFAGPTFNADILWNVTPLTSVRLRAGRSVEETSSTTIAGNTRIDFSVRVDHELYRYIIVSANAGYGSFSPNGAGVGGNEYNLGAGVRYLIDRHWSAGLTANYAWRDSTSTYLRYHAATVGISTRFAF
ncbi:MAG: outer membrane beta-barrel protein [Novosphingobium sp.]